MRHIPRILHYCWFGKKEKPESVKEFISTWKKNLPEYELMEWNEDNFLISEAIDYVKEAYSSGKFAFVSDYVRLYALYNYGGVYLDTDVEVLKSFDSVLDDMKMVLGFESDRSLLTAFIAVEKENEIIHTFLNSYNNRKFIGEDGVFDITTINEGFSKIMEQNGVNLEKNEIQILPGDIKVYPIPYFCGFDVVNWHETITKDTYTVHYMASSWVSSKKQRKVRIIKIMQKILGYKLYDFIKSKVSKK